MFNLANKLTLGRIAAVPLIVLLLYFPGKATCWVAFALFVSAAITDVIDGFVARSQSLVSNLGKFLDPLADKLLICSVLIMLVHLGWAPAWVAVLIIARELMVTGLRAMAADKGLVIAADKFGKIKTLTQIVALSTLIVHYPLGTFDPRPLGELLLYIALVLTVYSGWNYMRSTYAVWLKAE